jgi:hypothetical protein
MSPHDDGFEPTRAHRKQQSGAIRRRQSPVIRSSDLPISTADQWRPCEVFARATPQPYDILFDNQMVIGRRDPF